jgi:hypothetical protein
MCLIDKKEKSLNNKKNKSIDKVINTFKCNYNSCHFKTIYKSSLKQHKKEKKNIRRELFFKEF